MMPPPSHTSPPRIRFDVSDTKDSEDAFDADIAEICFMHDGRFLCNTDRQATFCDHIKNMIKSGEDIEPLWNAIVEDYMQDEPNPEVTVQVPMVGLAQLSQIVYLRPVCLHSDEVNACEIYIDWRPLPFKDLNEPVAYLMPGEGLATLRNLIQENITTAVLAKTSKPISRTCQSSAHTYAYQKRLEMDLTNPGTSFLQMYTMLRTKMCIACTADTIGMSDLIPGREDRSPW